MAITVEMLVAAGLWIASVGGFAWAIVTWCVSQLQRRDRALKLEMEKRDLALAAENARAKVAEDALAKSLADHKLYAAEHFATVGDLTNALQEVKAAIDKLSERMDRLLERPAPTRRGSS